MNTWPVWNRRPPELLKLIFTQLYETGSAAVVASVLFGAFITAFFAASLAGGPVIKILRRRRLFERTDKTPIEDRQIREDINSKQGIPTMGGIIIGIGLMAGVLLWGDLTCLDLWLCLASFFIIGALGMWDDYLKITGAGRRDRGMKVRHKLAAQGATGLVLGLIYMGAVRGDLSELIRPFPGHGYLLSTPVLWLACSAFVVALMSNSVNVADGMDGLAGGLSVCVLVPLASMAAFLSPAGGDAALAGVAMFCAILAGSTLGFLWHNIYPAKVFMGDTGAMGIGAGFGLAVLLSGYELLLPALAFVLLAEFASSVIQVLAFKITGRRILPIAPLHHICQKRKWPEARTVSRFWIAGLICSMGTLILAVAFAY